MGPLRKKKKKTFLRKEKCENQSNHFKVMAEHPLNIYIYRGLSREKIESVFGHFTKFNMRKTDSSQNST